MALSWWSVRGTAPAALAAERYDRDCADEFAIEDEIAAPSVAAVEARLYSAEDLRAKRKPSETLDAWECVARAMSRIGTRSPMDIAAARALLEKAVAPDARYARARSLLAHVTGLEALYGRRR